jgi:hypothetical protein
MLKKNTKKKFKRSRKQYLKLKGGAAALPVSRRFTTVVNVKKELFEKGKQ